MKAIIFIIAFLVFIFFKSAAYAVSISIVNSPSSISLDSFSINFAVSGASDGQNYFRIDLYKEGSSTYFGETYNGLVWYLGSEGKQYFPVTIIGSTASASIQGRLGSPGSEYSGPGVYKLKIRRYTSSGNASSSDNQTPVDISINYSSPTPTQLPTSTSTPTPSSTLAPTPTITPSTTSALTPTENPTLTNTPTLTPGVSISQEVLGSSRDPTSVPKGNSFLVKNSLNINNMLGFIFTFIGVIFLSLCGILFFWPVLKNKFTKHD